MPDLPKKNAQNSTKLSASGLVDAFRYLHPDTVGAYSWWSYMGGARARNIGWRIDYFVVSEALAPLLKEVDIRSDVTGSDHCPVEIEVKL